MGITIGLSPEITGKTTTLTTVLTEVFNMDFGDAKYKEIYFKLNDVGATVSSITEFEVAFSYDNSNWCTTSIGNIGYRPSGDLGTMAANGYIVLTEDSLVRFIRIKLAGTGTITIIPRIVIPQT
jgi:hypothetical protein